MGNKEPENSNMRIDSLKRYSNEFKRKEISEKISYSSSQVFKIRDSTKDYSLAWKYLEGTRDSRMSKHAFHFTIETPVDKLKDRDLPSPRVGNTSKGNLFLRMRKAK